METLEETPSPATKSKGKFTLPSDKAPPAEKDETFMESPSSYEDDIEDLFLSQISKIKDFSGEDHPQETLNAYLKQLEEQANLIPQKIDKYQRDYDAVLTLLDDISHRLRDHVCIGTPEPIVPVYVLLEEVRLHLKQLVKTSSDVGSFISEYRLGTCWKRTINQLELVKEENKELRLKLTKSTWAQMGLADVKEAPKKKRKCLIFKSLSFIVNLFVFAIVMMIVSCRFLTPEQTLCPLVNFCYEETKKFLRTYLL